MLCLLARLAGSAKLFCLWRTILFLDLLASVVVGSLSPKMSHPAVEPSDGGMEYVVP